MDIKDLYKQRKEKLTSAKIEANKTLDILYKKKQEFVNEKIREAKLNAEKEFLNLHEKEENDAMYALARAHDELMLLGCPEERYHRKPDGQYYLCETCGFVWDDTSPAHY